MSDYDIGKAFEKIETELISSMIRNLKRHKAEETELGFEWSQWQAEQLKALEEYRRRNQRLFPKEFNAISQKIRRALQDSYNDGETKQERQILQAIKRGFKGKGTNSHSFTGSAETMGEFFKTNERKLNSLIEATTHDMEKAEIAVLRMANDKYRKIIFNAQVMANTGAGTYEKAIDMATKDFLSAGINCIEYRNGRRVNIKSYAEMALRTANKRAYLQGEGTKRQEWRIYTVILNKRGNPCPLCAKFVGKVFIDDVWSGGPKNGISPVTGVKYPLLSEAIKQGLYHPNCRDSHTTYFEGISTPPEESQYTADELDEMADRYYEQQKAQHAQNEAERMERMSKFSLDKDNQRAYGARAEQWREKAEEPEKAVKNSDKSETKSYIDVKSEYERNATPGIGIIKYDDGYRIDLHKEEIEFANWLHNFYGGDIYILNEINKDKVPTPDYLWNNKLWDLKTTQTEKAANSAIRKGLKQIESNPGGIILNYGNLDVSMKKLQEIIDKRMQWYKGESVDIMIVNKEKVVKILRYKKT